MMIREELRIEYKILAKNSFYNFLNNYGFKISHYNLLLLKVNKFRII